MIGTKILEETTSKFNKNIKVVWSLGVGNYIQVNNLTQSGGVVETIWKSIVNKIPNTKEIGNICIFGLGGGTLVKLLRKKYPDAEIVGYEIDKKMVDLGKKYLNLDKYNPKIIIQDVNKVKIKKESFDLLIVDMYQGDNFPKEFDNETFLQKLKNYIKKDGIVIINRLYYGEKRSETVKFGKKLEKIFTKVIWHYPIANLMFLCI